MMDEEDDDEGFGDFKSAPSTAAADDDDWGDFMAGVGGLAHASSLPGGFSSLKPAIGVGLGSEDCNPDPAQPGSAPGRMGADLWEKPKGAIPLSIFGLEEEEEGEAGSGNDELPSFRGKAGKFERMGSGGRSSNLDDFIASLRYGGQPSNGPELGSNGSAMVDIMGGKVSGFGRDEFGLSPNAYVNGENEVGMRTTGSGLKWDSLDLNSGGFESVGILHSNGATPGLVEGVEAIENGGGHEEDDDDGAWEFKFVDAEVAQREVAQCDSTNNGGSSNINLRGPESGNNMFPLGLAGMDLNSDQVATQKQQLTVDSADQDEDPDVVEYWGFKTAHPVLQFNGISEIQWSKKENMPTHGSVAQHSSWNIFDPSMGGVHSDVNGMNLGESDLKSDSVEESENLWADDAWEFRTAESEAKAKGSNNEVDVRSPGNSESTVVTSGVGNHATGNEDVFASSQVTSQKSGEWDFEFGLASSSGTGNNIASGTIVHNDVGNSLQFSPADGNFYSAEASWAFKDTTLDSSAVDEEVPTSARNSPALEALAFDSTTQAEEVTPDSQKRALPLSIFGEEEIESDEPVISEDVPIEMAKFKSANAFNSSHPDISIKDLISSLYSQIEHSSSAEHAVSRLENGAGFTTSVIDSNLLVCDNDNLDDDSWEFQDATVGNMDQDQNRNLANVYANAFTDLELENCLSLFIKLKEELLFAALGHLENLKKAQSSGAINVNDDEIDALHNEIQDIDNELGKDAVFSAKLSPKERNFNSFVEILREPKFRKFESEYEISKKLMMVEKDSRSVIELLKLVASIVRILKLASREDQLSYVSTWSKMLAACAQELRHGALIWKKLLEKSACDSLLSEPRGKDYVLSLGEIYRVAEVLGSSARVYKPWIYVNSVDSMSLVTLLNECASIWSASGLEEALRCLLDSSHAESCKNHEILVESIKYIQDMDKNALYDHVFSGVEPSCQLSLLKAFPGMQIVFWDGKPYHLTLANLWANRISYDPPVLPSLPI